MFAAVERSGVPATCPFGLFEVDDGGLCLAFSTIDCVDCCLPLATDGRPPLVGGGVPFISWKALCTGEEAIDGDIAAELRVLFLLASG